MLLRQRGVVRVLLLVCPQFLAIARASRCRCGRRLGVSDGVIGRLGDFADDSVMLPRESQR